MFEFRRLLAASYQPSPTRETQPWFTAEATASYPRKESRRDVKHWGKGGHSGARFDLHCHIPHALINSAYERTIKHAPGIHTTQQKFSK